MALKNLREYKEPDWQSILLDFCFWGTIKVNGRLTDNLPCDCLANLWVEISKRKHKEINAMNYSAALLAGAKYSQPGAKVNVTDWLPYNTDDGKKEQPQLDEALQKEIMMMDLPPGMMRDLINTKLITPKE